MKPFLLTYSLRNKYTKTYCSVLNCIEDVVAHFFSDTQCMLYILGGISDL